MVFDMDEIQEFNNLLTITTLRYPFYGYLLKKIPVYLVNESEDIETIAVSCNETSFSILLTKKFFNYDLDEKIYIISHEALHIIMNHFYRDLAMKKMYNISDNYLNIIEDAKINHILDLDFLADGNFHMPENRITIKILSDITGMDTNELEKLSVEEIVAKLVLSGKITTIISKVLLANEKVILVLPLPGGVVLLNVGDDELNGKTKVVNIENMLKGKLGEAIALTNLAGTVPRGAKRIMNEMAESKVDWRRLLRDQMDRSLGNEMRKSWSRENRKNPDLPCKQPYGKKDVIILVDTSGSIDDKILKEYLAELYSIARLKANIRVIPWDASVYEEIKVTSPSDIDKVKKGLKGGGGTLILPALKKAIEIRKNNDTVIIFSDFYIGDINKKVVRSLLHKLNTVNISYGIHPKEVGLKGIQVLGVEL